MGDMNAKVGNERDGYAVSSFGVGVRNENGNRLFEFCGEHTLLLLNKWFQQKESVRHTWTSPNGLLKNQVYLHCNGCTV